MFSNKLLLILTVCFVLNFSHGESIGTNEDTQKRQSLEEKGYYPIPQTKALYKLHQLGATLNNATTFCEDEGASLYYPETEKESNTVVRFMQTHKGSRDTYGWFLGIVRSGNNFVPINGTAISNAYIRWNTGEPNNAGGAENCVVFLAEPMTMNDVSCFYKFGFICKWQPNERGHDYGASDSSTDVTPYYGQETTEITDVTPDYGQETTEITDVTPDYGQETTEITDVTPDYGQETTGITDITPDYGQETTEITDVTPDYGQETTEITDGESIGTNEDTQKRQSLEEKGYYPIPQTKALYKLHQLGATLNNATTFCEDEGASLYYPETEKESNTVVRFMQAHKGGRNTYGWFLGIVRSENNFVPINGTSISNAYIRWNTGEPNNAGGAENCVVFLAEPMTMNDISCLYKFGFICKWQPNDGDHGYGVSVSDVTPDYGQETTENTGSSSDYGEITTGYIDVTPDYGQETTEITDSSSYYGEDVSPDYGQETTGNTGRVSSERTTNLNQSNDLEENSYDFIPQTKSLYKLHLTTKTFDEAKATCDDEGAVLYYPESEDESNAVLKFMINKYQETLPNKLYLGNVKPASLLETLSGLSISKLYNNWLLREPNNNHPTENCVEFVTSQNLVNDVTCNRQSAFICKRRQSEWNEYCHMLDLDYGYSEETGKCYKFHLTPKNWTDAQETCRAERSHLAVINSHEEASYIVRLTRSSLRNIPGKFTRGVILLGFYNDNVKNWQTIEGTSLYYSGYACWGNNQPDGGERDRCGSMFYNGHLNDIACDQKAYFICEHDIAALNYEHEPRSMYNVIQSLRCYDTI